MVEPTSPRSDDVSLNNPNPILGMGTHLVEHFYVHSPSDEEESVNSSPSDEEESVNSHGSSISPRGSPSSYIQLGIPPDPVQHYYVLPTSEDELTADQLLALESLDFVTVGLPAETVASLPVVQFKKGEANDVKGAEMCTICLEDFEDGKNVVQLPCSHILHPQCAAQLFRNTNQCPLCRDEVEIEMR